MFFAGIACSLTVCLAVSLLLAGPKSLISYPDFILQTESPLFGTPASQLISLPPASAALVFVLLLVCVVIIRPRFLSSLMFLPFFLCLLSGHTLGQDLSLLLFPLFYLLRFRPGFGFLLLVSVSLGFFIFPRIVSLLILFSGFYLLFSPFPNKQK
jgi:hypothetical protein